MNAMYPNIRWDIIVAARSKVAQGVSTSFLNDSVTQGQGRGQEHHCPELGVDSPSLEDIAGEPEP
jgi:hypothetical protein